MVLIELAWSKAKCCTGVYTVLKHPWLTALMFDFRDFLSWKNTFLNYKFYIV